MMNQKNHIRKYKINNFFGKDFIISDYYSNVDILYIIEIRLYQWQGFGNKHYIDTSIDEIKQIYYNEILEETVDEINCDDFFKTEHLKIIKARVEDLMI